MEAAKNDLSKSISSRIMLKQQKYSQIKQKLTSLLNVNSQHWGEMRRKEGRPREYNHSLRN